LNGKIYNFVKQNKQIDSYIKDQLRRASVSVVINIAEGSGKFSKADKKNFYTIARGSVYECVSLFEIIKQGSHIAENEFSNFYQELEIVSKMLFGLINSQS